MSVEEVEVMRSLPLWATRLAVAHTIPRECRAEQAWVYQPGQFARIVAPTLFLVGSDTTADLGNATVRAIAAIGDVRVQVLDGHGHMAHKTDPAMVAQLVKEFCAT